MAKVVLTCGKICSGKSTYARRLGKELKAVVLSVDEITLALFGPNAGEKHDEYVEKAEKYLFGKSVEIINTGINVILDWGFWTKTERDFARNYYGERGIECELHCIDIGNELWSRRLKERNSAVLSGETLAYYVDEGLAKKFASIYEAPTADEADAWIRE